MAASPIALDRQVPTAASGLFASGHLLALLSAGVLSFTAILARYLTEHHQLPALVLCFWRAGLVAACLLPVLGLSTRVRLRVPRELGFLLGFGVLLAVFNGLWTLSVALNGAAVATVLVYSSGAFTAILGRWLLGERGGPGVGAAVALSFAGCVLVTGALQPHLWLRSPLGILTGLLSGLGYAVYTLLGRRAAQRGIDPWVVLFYTFGTAALVMLAVNLWPNSPLPGSAAAAHELLWLGRSLAGWGALVLLAVGPTLIGFGLYNLSLNRLPAAVVNLIAILEPVFTALAAYLLLAERMTGAEWLGSALIMAGVLMLRVGKTRQEPNHGPAPRRLRRVEAGPVRP